MNGRRRGRRRRRIEDAEPEQLLVDAAHLAGGEDGGLQGGGVGAGVAATSRMRAKKCILL